MRKILALLLFILLTGCGAAGQAGLTVGAAANMTNALTEIARLYTQETGQRVELDLAASGQIAQHVRQGAPLDLVILADESYVDQLETEGLLVPGSKRIYARGQLVLWTRDSQRDVSDLAALAGPTITRIAIANPDLAPYGRAAVESLQSAGLWEAVVPKVVYGENVRQALQYAQTGDADVALVPLSLVIGIAGRYEPIAESLHQPLDQALAVVQGTGDEKAAWEFVAFLTGPVGRRVLEQYGYTVAEEQP